MKQEGGSVMGSGTLKYRLSSLEFRIINPVYSASFFVKLVEAELISHVACERKKDGNAHRKPRDVNKCE